MNSNKGKKKTIAFLLTFCLCVALCPPDRCLTVDAADAVSDDPAPLTDVSQGSESETAGSVAQEKSEETSEQEPASADAQKETKKDSLSLAENTVTLTKGFSEKFAVTGAVGTVTWSSDNSAVAAVNQKGKVTAKKKGTAVITASDEKGSASCQVKVEPNTYRDTKYTVSQTEYGNAYLNVYKISYDKKGNLVIKTQLLNNSGRKVIKLKSVKIKVKNAKGKTIGTYRESQKEISVKQGKAKKLTLTIKKSDLKNSKVQDLRQITDSDITVSFSYEQNI